jgi:Putative MetA-pathway of phenol degradation
MRPVVLAAAVLGAAVLGAAHAARGQELNPRAYLITPVGTNAINLAYTHLEGTLDVNGAAPITGATASADLTAFGYYRAVDLFGRSANFALAVPYGVGEFSGTLAEAPKHARRSGLLDSSLRLAVNLIGGPAMQPKEFSSWRQDILLGVSLKVVAPTGQYDPMLLVNWGTNRWAFKPEIGYSQRWNDWVLDGYASMWFFAENPEFFSHNQYFPGVQSQTQRPVAALEAHLSYDLRPRLWISLDANYWSGGETSLNGVANPSTYQRSSRVGVTASIPITARHSIKISYSEGAYVRYGGNYRAIFAAWQYGWVGSPFH